MQKPTLLRPFWVIILFFSINLSLSQNKKLATTGRNSYFTLGYGQAIGSYNFGESNLFRFGYEQRFADHFGVEAYTHVNHYQTSPENYVNYDLRLRLLYHFEHRFHPQIVVEPVTNVRYNKNKLSSQRVSDDVFQTIKRSKFDPYLGLSIGGTLNEPVRRSRNYFAGTMGILAGLRFIPTGKWGIFIESTASLNDSNLTIDGKGTSTLQAGTVF